MCGDRQLVDVAHDRHDQPALGVDGDPEIHVILVNDFAPFHVERGVEQRILLEGQGDRLHHEDERGELDVRAGVVGDAPFANSLEFGDVGVVEIRQMRNREGRADHVGRDRLAHLGERLAADRPPGVAILRLGESAGGRRGVAGRMADGRDHVLAEDPPVGPRAARRGRVPRRVREPSGARRDRPARRGPPPGRQPLQDPARPSTERPATGSARRSGRCHAWPPMARRSARGPRQDGAWPESARAWPALWRAAAWRLGLRGRRACSQRVCLQQACSLQACSQAVCLPVRAA